LKNELKFSKAKQVGKPFYTADEFREMVLSEDDLQTAVDQYLLRTGWVRPGSLSKEGVGNAKGIFFHINNDVFRGKRNPININLKNLPDTLLLHPQGKCKLIELKSKKGKRTRGQIALAKIIPIEEHKIFEKVVESIEKWY